MEPTPDASLWIGGSGDLHRFETLFERGIQAIVDLALEEQRLPIPRELIYCRFPLNDGGGNSEDVLRFAVDTVAALTRARVTTLVCCSAGMSRSPTIVSFAIASRTGESPESILRRIGDRASLEANQALWKEVAKAVSGV